MIWLILLFSLSWALWVYRCFRLYAAERRRAPEWKKFDGRGQLPTAAERVHVLDSRAIVQVVR